VRISPTVRRWLLKRRDPGVRPWRADVSDPSVRARVLAELLERGPDDPELRAARREIGRVGWAAEILDEQLPRGQWVTPGTGSGELYRPKYIATNWRLLVLADLGVPATDPRVRRGVDLFLDVFARAPWSGLGGRGSEGCFTGNAVRMLVAFGRADDRRTRRSIAWILDSQKSDGGWHCFPSKTGTLDVWEPLSALAALPPTLRTAAVERAISRGAEFYLERGLLREGRPRYAPWYRLHFPVHYYYDVLVGLDLLTRLGYAEDRRLRPALDHLESLRRPDGRWEIGPAHPDSEDPNYRVRGPVYPFVLETPGSPSRWITATALAVLDRAGR
jgi:hypothetical protein